MPQWTDKADRDVLVAVIKTLSGADGKYKIPWDAVHAEMTANGYPYSKDAMSQRFSKTLIKDYGSGNANADANGESTGDGQVATPIPKKKRTPRKPKAKKGEENDEGEEGGEEATPKPKKKRTATPRKPKAVKSEAKAESEHEEADEDESPAKKQKLAADDGMSED